MLVRKVRPEEKAAYNQAVAHPLQSWEWGEFRQKTGVQVERLGFFEAGRLMKGAQLTFHPIPVLGGTAGYFPKGPQVDAEQLQAITEIGTEQQAVFIKLEPQLQVSDVAGSESKTALQQAGAVPARALFSKHTFILNIEKPEEELFADLESKTRYNVNLSARKGVTIFEDSSEKGLQTHLDILAETTKRQGFYAHGADYFRHMWETLLPSGMLHIFHAQYEGTILASWIMFVFNGVLYYPYGASRDVHRNVMASNLLMWEMIRFGKSVGCHSFDMWGALGADPDKNNPWYGFHKFKKGYGAELVEYIGSYDLPINATNYKLFKLGDTLRWKYLRLRSRVG